MAAAGADMSKGLGVNGKGNRGTETNNGLVTPEATPSVDDRRIDAEKARQAAELAATAETEKGDESESDLSEYETDDDGNVVPILAEDAMDDVTANDGIPWPSKLIGRIYQEATPHLGKLMIDSTDPTALGALKALNDKIKQQNEKEENPPDGWIIDVPFFASNFEMAKPYMDRLLKRGEGEPADQESVKKLDEINATMREMNTKHHYPEDWVINPPSEEVVAMAQAAKKEADETLAKRKAEKKAKKKADKEAAAAAAKAAADKEAADKVAADKAAADKAAADKIAADKAVADKAAAEAAKKAAKEYLWKTLDTPDGRRIMAGRQHSKLGKVQDKSTLIVATDLSDDPIYDMTTGSNVGTLEVEEFFKLDGIKLLAEKRENGEDVKTWTWRDKEDFVEFLWCTRGTRDTTTFGKGSKAPDTYCGVRMKKGIELLTMSNLGRVIGPKSANSRIKEYCKRKGITPPWDVEAQNEKVPKEKKLIAAQTWLAEQGLGNFAPPAAGFNSGAGHSTSGWTTVNSTSGNSTAGSSDIKLLTERIDAMEKQIRTQSSNTGGSSLDSLLKKMDSMEANMNKRLDTMETKITQVDALTTNMNNLSSIVGLLMEKAGLNAASA